jgi:hypothetical protein
MRGFRRGVLVSVGGVCGVVLASALASCGSKKAPFGDGDGTGGSGGTGAHDGGGLFGNGAQQTSLRDASSCAAVVEKGETLPVDMYVLLDRSSSMLDSTGTTGVSKWSAINTALESFVKDPDSAGLGIGLQYFPLFKPNVPATCTSNAACGAGGPCFLQACDNQTTVTACTTNADCGVGNCIPFGVCSLYPVGGTPVFCSPIGSACSAGYGDCVDFNDRWCVNGVECTSDSYATPAVPIAALPANESAVVTSIQNTQPQGDTPTGPALQGAIQHATDWATSHPGHRVVAVLATDGLPTDCSPTDITQVSAFATTGLNAATSIPTFVIGVFGPNDSQSPANLNTIARAGGTGQAFIVDTSGNVTTQFQTALNSIRGRSVLSCDLKIPDSTSSDPLDLARVNLEITPATGAKTQLVYVTTLAGCSSEPGRGWYYDQDPSTGATPTKIIVCPDICQTFQSLDGASLNLQIGCAQILR